MFTIKGWIVTLLTTAGVAAGCAAPNGGQRDAASNANAIALASSDADAKSLDIAPSAIGPLATPINIAIQPLRPVSFRSAETDAANPGLTGIAHGQIWFERNKEGLIERHTVEEGETVQRAKGGSVEIPYRLERVSVFKPDGRIWAIMPTKLDMATDPAPGTFSKETWEKLRAPLAEETKPDTPMRALRCMYDGFIYRAGSVKVGQPLGPATPDQLFDQIADCIIADSRGHPDQTTQNNLKFRQNVLTASDEELKQIHDRVRDHYKEKWFKDTHVTGQVLVKGMVVREGQEFIYASGQLHMTTNGGAAQGTITIQTLIDPYTGLPYRTVQRSETSGMTEQEDPLFVSLNGVTQVTSLDIPTRTPPQVTIGQKREPVTATGGAGTVADLYKRTIGAIFEVETANGLGTGFAIGPDVAITAAHVVEGTKTVTLVPLSGAPMRAIVVKRDSVKDVALLRLQGGSFQTTLPLSNDFPVTGAQVVVIGCPLGACGSVTTGIVSFAARQIEGAQMVQIDALINPGNSGGPILNTNGEVIAIVEEKINPDPTFEGLNFGLSSTEILTFVGG